MDDKTRLELEILKGRIAQRRINAEDLSEHYNKMNWETDYQNARGAVAFAELIEKDIDALLESKPTVRAPFKPSSSDIGV
jgi:hypothetical protein